MRLHKRVQQILDEIRTVLDRIDSTAVSAMVERLRAARRIYVAGGGRSGLMVRSFAQRLMQLGFTTYVVGETTTPAISKADVLLVCSGSGETQVTVLVSQVARQIGAHVIAITANPDSSIAKVADTLLVLDAPHKQAPKGGIPSIQYGGSAFEQSLVILLDAIALEIGLLLGRSQEELEERHANLE
jgi:6-phospho-3-hexuloisomerase